MSCRILATASDPVSTDPLPADQVVAGNPTAGVTEFEGVPVPCGLWEHTVGTSTDVEVDEVFVVLSGRATITVADEAPLEIAPGDVVMLAAGTHTTWQVTQPMRKFWVTPQPLSD